MAQIFWVRGAGAGKTEASRPRQVPIDTVVEKLVPFEKRFFDEPPDLDPGRYAHDDDWHVFVHVHDEETNAGYPEEGYYEVVHVTPEDCRRLFSFQQPA